jgi:hypothetical protein
LWRTPVAALIAFVAADAAHAQVQRNTKPLTPFRIDVNETIVNVTMPFDAKFILWGDVPAPTSDVTLEIRTVQKGAADCSNRNSGTRKQRTTVKTRKWRGEDYTKHDASAPDDLATRTDLQFELVVNELEPSKFYCFTFELKPGRKMTDAEALTFSQTLLPAYRAFMQSRPPTATFQLGRREAELLRQEFLRALLEGSGGRLTPLPGTEFDPDADPNVVASEFLADTVAVFDQHTEAIRRLQNVVQNASRTSADRLLALAQSPAMAALEGRADLTPDQVAAVRFFRGLTAPQSLRVLQGLLPSDTTSGPLIDAWIADPGFPSSDDPSFTADSACPSIGEIAPRCQTLDQVRRWLNALATFDFGGGPLTFLAVQTNVNTQKTELLFAQNAVNRRDDLMRIQLTKIRGFLPQEFVLLTTTTGSAETRRTWYLSMDTGIAVAPVINEVFPYIGTNIYFRPVNTAVPPSSRGTRLSMLFGFTWTANLSKEREREALFGEDAMIVLGGGVRATEFLRFTGGALVFKGFEANPLRNSETRIEVTPFISMSADIDLAGVLGHLFGGAATPPEAGRTLAPK